MFPRAHLLPFPAVRNAKETEMIAASRAAGRRIRIRHPADQER
jgi:hypothetical protein